MTHQQILKIYRDQHSELNRFLLGKGVSNHEAEDILQEANVRLLQMSGKQLDAIEQPRAYFYSMVSNLSIDSSRKRSVRERGATDIDIDTLSRRPDQPDTIASGQEHIALLMDTIKALPDRCREVFLLYKFRNLTQKQIARELDISLNMVEKHIIQAHTRLRDALPGVDEQ